MIRLDCTGTDAARAAYTLLFAPNPTQISGGTGDLTDYTSVGGGSGDITGSEEDFKNRNGVNPTGGQGVL